MKLDLLLKIVTIGAIAACANMNKNIPELVDDKITELSSLTPLRNVITDTSFVFACILRPYDETRIRMGTFLYPENFDIGMLDNLLPVPDDRFIITISSKDKKLTNNYALVGKINVQGLKDETAGPHLARVSCGEIDEINISKETVRGKVIVDFVVRVENGTD